MASRKASTSVPTARQIAVQVLRQCDPRKQRVSTVLDPLLSRTRESQRCTDLIYGVLRWREALDTVISRVGGRTLRSIQKPLLPILRVAVYELTQCPESAEHAVIHEAVELTKQGGGKAPAGFVNALCRRIQRSLVSRQRPLDPGNLRRTLVQDPHCGCVFDMDLWPDPNEAPVEYLSRCYNLPAWLVKSWLAAYGFEKTVGACLACNRRPHVYLRPNPCQQDPQATQTSITESGVQAELSSSGLLRLKGGGMLSRLPGFNEGWFSVQDPTAARVASVIVPQPGERFLDLCAAPGGKTTHLAELAQDRATIFATDIDDQRLQQVRDNTQRLRLSSIQVLPYTELDGLSPKSFDGVLLDVPCSNTGVLAKRVEARYRLRQNAMQELLDTQAQLLNRATEFVTASGRIAYSTCSIQPEENEEQVRAFLIRYPDYRCITEHCTLPLAGQSDHDGGYVALLGKK